jgi:hypothetical protein
MDSNIYLPIYKVNHLINKDTIDNIYVFYGDFPIDPNTETEINLNDLFKNEPKNNLFYPSIFNDEEISSIEKNNIAVTFLSQRIYFDDSIGAVKIKINSEISSISNKFFSLEEMYLFCMREETMNAVSIYETLTQNKRISLTKVRLYNFLLNIIRDNNGNNVNIKLPENINNKSVFDFEDIISLNINNKTFWVNKAIGQKYYLINNEYSYVINPFDNTNKDDFIEQTKRTLTTSNSELLLDTGKIINNNIYLCLATDVLNYINTSDTRVTTNIQEEQYIIKMYYPFLFSNNIFSLADLEKEQNNLIELDKKLINTTTTDSFDITNLFYNVYLERKNELKYEKRGITHIRAIMHPSYNTHIPIDVIFKLLHATKDVPLVKYNPATRQENIYRLYADAISVDGRKIPYLNKATIFKLVKTLGRDKMVSLYIEDQTNNELYNISCEFESNGIISIIGNFKNPMNVDEIDNLFKSNINNIINNLNDYLQQNGYYIELFKSLHEENIEIRNLKYDTVIEITKNITIKNLTDCISSIFTIESDTKNDIQLRFKKVANYSKTTSQEAFIIEKQNDGLRGIEIIDALLQSFPDMKREDAIELFEKIVSEVELQRKAKRKTATIKNNPGFKTNIVLNREKGQIVITVDNINNIYYLDTIPVYLDTMIRLTQDKESTDFSLERINELCFKSKKNDKELEMLKLDFDDIISASESSIIQNDVNKEINKLELEEIEKEETKSQIDNDEILNIENIDSEIEQKDAKEKIANVLNLFYGDYDEEEEEESEEKSSGEKIGGVGSDENTNQESNQDNLDNKETEFVERNIQQQQEGPMENKVKDIVGMKLSNPFLFQERLEEREPILILKEEKGKYNRYSRTCPSTTRRQPVILTQAELDRINKEQSGFLKEEDIIKYGSNPDNKFYYVCPRYWNLKTDTLITPEEIAQKNLEDKIIPKKANKVPPGKYIYEFYTPPKNQPNYKHFPGFQVDKHPDGYCLPCCFNSWNTPKQIERRKTCSENNIVDVSDTEKIEDQTNVLEETGEKEEAPKISPTKKIKEKKPELENYVIGPEKFPISKGRWGYLPTAIQKILMEVNYNCQISKTNTNIKPDHTCLVRHGVESDMYQSFIGCIADAIFFTQLDENKKPVPVPSIKKMKEIIIDTLNIDNFITFQNGDLVNLFMDDKKESSYNKLQKYKTSNLYKKLSKNNINENTDIDIDSSNTQNNLNETETYFNKVIHSYENFIDFLRSSDTIIDYTYLWDIVCRPHPLLFKKGINLVILEIPNNDITNNVDFICPTNHYSTHLYDAKKPTLILIKQDTFFEPIYSYRYNKSNETLFVGKLFSEHDTKLSVTMRDFFNKIVKPYIQNMCIPLPSIPNLYKTTHPILLEELLTILNKHNYKILYQVVNYQNKVIGINISKNSNDNNFGFIPCFPSSIHENIDYLFMTDKNIWNNYSNTLNYLLSVYKDSKGKIPCNPILKIVEDELVVGFLTQTNQFVQLSTPVPINSEIIKDDIPLLKDEHYVVFKNSQVQNIDVATSLSNTVDNERVEYIKKIKMEYEFYQVFRTTIRILLNDYENIKIRESIEDELNKNYLLYFSKIDIVKKLLKELVSKKNTVLFTDNYNYDLIKEITTCITQSTNNSDETETSDKTSGEKSKCLLKSPLCVVSDKDNICQLILPKKNLVTGKDNELIYYEKMADELIRYIRINKYIFEPKTYLSFENMGYNLNDDEILLFQSLITQEYFENLIPTIPNKYIHFNTYDSVEPILTEHYEDTFKIDPNNPTPPPIQSVIAVKPTTVKPVKKIIIEPEEVRESLPEKLCDSTINDKISSGIWKKCFPSVCGEKEYGKTVECTFQLIIDIVREKNKIESSEKQQRLSINSIRKYLYDEYKKYLPTYEGQILDILMGQGKKSLIAKVKSKLINFYDMIFSENYYLTTLDYWILLTKWQISSFFISSKFLFDTKYNQNNLLVFDEKNTKELFAFIVIPGVVNDIIPVYKTIINKENNLPFISLKNLNDCEGRNDLMNTMDEYNENKSVDYYIKHFSREKKTVYKKKKPTLIIDESSSNSQNNESSSNSFVMSVPKTTKPKNVTKKNIIKKIVNRQQNTKKNIDNI